MNHSQIAPFALHGANALNTEFAVDVMSTDCNPLLIETEPSNIHTQRSRAGPTRLLADCVVHSPPNARYTFTREPTYAHFRSQVPEINAALTTATLKCSE